MRVWNASTGKCVYTTDSVHAKQQVVATPDNNTDSTEADGQNVVQVVYNGAQNTVTVVTYDQNISILGLEKLRLQKQVRNVNAGSYFYQLVSFAEHI